MVYLYIVIFAISFIVLTRSSHLLVRALTALSRFLNLSEYITAFIFMSFFTSIPELFIGISSALGGIPEFSLGDILGANVVNISLILGIVALLGNGLAVEGRVAKKNFLLVSGLAFLPLLLATDGIISRGDGVVLIIAFLFYLFRISGEKEYFSKTINHLKKGGVTINALKILWRAFLAVGLLLLASFAIVYTGGKLAKEVGLSIFGFAVIFASLGTAIPELAFSIEAKILKHGTMAVGNAVGTMAFNAAMIVGLVSLIYPIRIAAGASLIIVAAFLFVSILAFNIFVYSRSFVSRKEGALLVIIYLLFLAIQILAS
jgi:cation:H+ antiporter